MFGKKMFAAVALVASFGMATMPTAEAGLGHWLSHVGGSKLDQFEHSLVGAVSIGAGVASMAGGIVVLGGPILATAAGLTAIGIGTGGVGLIVLGIAAGVFGFHEMFLSDAAQTKAEQGANVRRNAGTKGGSVALPPSSSGGPNMGMHH